LDENSELLGRQRVNNLMGVVTRKAYSPDNNPKKKNFICLIVLR
jgi:hypothetical protein